MACFVPPSVCTDLLYNQNPRILQAEDSTKCKLSIIIISTKCHLH